MQPREPMYAALFALLQPLLTASAIVTVPVITLSRKLQHWKDVPLSQQPAVFMAQGNENVQRRARGTPGRNRFAVKLYVYVNTSGELTPATVLNPVLDEIQALLEPSFPGAVQTLGGLVDHCWIEGEIETYEGTLGDQEVAIVPIEILVPS